VFGELTTGAADDFRQATELARSMVTEWGMSEKLGPLTYGQREESILPFMPGPRRGDYSEETSRQIDAEVHRIVVEQYARAEVLISANREKLDAIANALLERETLDAFELDAVLSGQPMPDRTRVVIPTYADKQRQGKEKRKASIFQPRPREVPSEG
jgi:cell division protease FtsH